MVPLQPFLCRRPIVVLSALCFCVKNKTDSDPGVVMFKDIAFGAESMGFDSRPGQIRHSVPITAATSSERCCAGAEPRSYIPPLVIRFDIIREYDENLIF